MLDMGFKPQLDEIVHKHFMLDKFKRQNLLFSLLFQMKYKELVTII